MDYTLSMNSKAKEQKADPDADRAVLWKANAFQSPLSFVRDVLGVREEEDPKDPKAPRMEVWQREALAHLSNCMATRQPVRMSIKAGHGVGKTTFMAWTIIWFTLSRINYKIPVAANSQTQLKDTIWSEIGLWLNKLPPQLRNRLTLTTERLYLNASAETSFAVARTANKARLADAIRVYKNRNDREDNGHGRCAC